MPPSTALTAAHLHLQAPLEFITSRQRRKFLRAYLKSLGPNDLTTLPFRDLRDDMVVWAQQFQAALAPAMHRARDSLLSAIAKENRQAPASVNAARDLQSVVCAGRAVAAQLRPPGFCIPPLAMTMLAEAWAELVAQLRGLGRKPSLIQTCCEYAVRNILVQTGFLSSLLSGLSGPSATVAFKVITYVKAVFGMDGTSQGMTADIVRAVENDERNAAARFLDKLCAALAAPMPAEEIHWPHADMDGETGAAKEHAKVKRELFIDTWDKRGRRSIEYRRRGLCHYLQTDGRLVSWIEPASLIAWLDGAPSDTLHEVILHVAGPQLLRYVREYLLGGERGKALGLLPDADFKPELAVLLRREADDIVLDFRAVDDNFNRKGLVAETDAMESDVVVDDSEEDDARACVHLEVRLQIRFRRPDSFQMHSALIVKAEY